MYDLRKDILTTMDHIWSWVREGPWRLSTEKDGVTVRVEQEVTFSSPPIQMGH